MSPRSGALDVDAQHSGHDVVVVGGSAGSIEATVTLLAALPADLAAAVCVTIHQAPYVVSRLHAVLARAGPLRAVEAVDGAPLERGVVHVCVPDLHLTVERDVASPGAIGGRIRLVRGPKENRTRPAVDPLFRSAALAFGPRVIGVVLSGALDDGTAGLWAIRDRGGLAVVQDPGDAVIASMPTNAIAEAGADHVAPAHELGPLLVRLVAQPAAPASAARHDDGDEALGDLAREVAVTAIDETAHSRSARYGEPSRFACPDCGGVLWDTSHGRGPLRFRCETGHAYSPASLAEQQTVAVEDAMWAALRALEDKAELARARAERAEARGLTDFARYLTAQAQASQEHAAAMRALLRLDGRTGMELGA